MTIRPTVQVGGRSAAGRGLPAVVVRIISAASCSVRWRSYLIPAPLMNSSATRIRTCSGQQAHIAAAFLKSHGIECRVVGDELADQLSWYGSAVVKVDLLVPSEDAEQAIVLLTELDIEQTEERAARRFGRLTHGWVCDACGEVCEPQFALCWYCQADRPESPEWEPLPSPDPQSSDSVPATAPPEVEEWTPYGSTWQEHNDPDGRHHDTGSRGVVVKLLISAAILWLLMTAMFG